MWGHNLNNTHIKVLHNISYFQYVFKVLHYWNKSNEIISIGLRVLQYTKTTQRIYITLIK
jgi:hypothetical protein